MEAKDTVMTNEELDRTWQIHVNSTEAGWLEVALKGLIEKQAEISFKAGQREVVEWVKEHEDSKFIDNYLLIPKEKWQAKLKDWGKGD